MNTFGLAKAPGRKFCSLETIPIALSRFRFVKALNIDWKANQCFTVLTAEVLLACISYILAVFAFAESRDEGWLTQVVWATLGPVIAFRLAALLSVRLYSRSLRHAGIPELISIAKIVSASSIMMGASIVWLFSTLNVPAAVFVMDWAIVLLLWGGLHLGNRILRTEKGSWRRDGKKVLVVGAGDAGITLLKDLAQDSSSLARPVALVDDNPEKWGRSILGVPVVGGIRDLARLAAENKAEEILVRTPSATSAQMRDILGACRETGIPVRTLPSLTELADGKISRRDLRKPGIDDLLQRTEIAADLQETRRLVRGKVILITGAGGSIGSELSRQIADGDPRTLLLLDKAENSLFYIHREVSERLGPGRARPVLADLVYKDRLREILQRERPEIVFHAAAHKHVGLLELHPQEAIRNNIFGTRNISEAALACGTLRFVNISTDKVVNPTSYLGLSKKLTEMCIQECAQVHKVRFSNVRFGNVAGSTGSVLLLFRDQIRRGCPVRVTDPRASRYFMSVPEAVHLILRAAALGKGGETFVLDMGTAVNIYQLARTMMLFAGLQPDRDSAIKFTGLNAGEKITEELWESTEMPVSTGIPRIMVIAQQNAGSAGIARKIDFMETLLAHGDGHDLLEFASQTVPGFKHARANLNCNKDVPVMTSVGAA
jgi:FlaA1/EpsC-like NDP-sugar epimerase